MRDIKPRKILKGFWQNSLSTKTEKTLCYCTWPLTLPLFAGAALQTTPQYGIHSFEPAKITPSGATDPSVYPDGTQIESQAANQLR